jgi:ABC-2 type transport system ATP-binding protein
MSKPALVFCNVSKRFGNNYALRDLSFTIPRGHIVGFVGPNGAGKTTAFSLVAGYLNVDAGDIDILGYGPFDPFELKGKLGVLPQDAELSLYHTPRELLEHLGRLSGLNARQASLEATRLLTTVGLADRMSQRIGALSHGMRRRVAVATALLGDPDLVLLDEPLAGLDPVQAHGVRDVILNRPKGQTVVVSSHNLLELERICDWVVMLDSGELLREGSVSEVTGATEKAEWELTGPAPLAALQEAFPAHSFSCQETTLSHTMPVGGDMDAVSVVVVEILAAARIGVRGVRRGVGLEQQFIDDQKG